MSIKQGENQDVGDTSEKSDNRNSKSLGGELFKLGTLKVRGEYQRPDEQRGQKDVTGDGMLADAAPRRKAENWSRGHAHERIVGQEEKRSELFETNNAGAVRTNEADASWRSGLWSADNRD